MRNKYTKLQLPPGRLNLQTHWCGKHLLTLLSLFLVMILLPSQLLAQRMWINEFHYDDAGGDINEFVEIVVEDGAILNDIKLKLYNGANGQPYGSIQDIAPGDFEAGASLNCFTIYAAAISGIQNGAPDGFALIYQGVVVHFLSYEGTFLGSTNEAAGFLSQDAGISEAGDPEGTAIGLTGTGTKLSDFTFAKNTATPGALNVGQNLSDPSLAASMTDTPDPSEPVAPGDKIKYTITLANAGDGDAKGVSLDRMLPLDLNTTLVAGSFKSTPIAYDAYVINVPEDAVNFSITLSAFDPDGDLLTYSITSNPSNGTLGSVSPVGPTAGSATVPYTPNADYFGPDQLEFTVTDDDGGSCPAIINIMVQPVNDPPTITCGSNQLVVNTAGAQSIAGWATGISVGPANEAFQDPATITVTNDNNSLFSTQPAVATNATLSYTPMAGTSGVANVTVTISDGVPADDVSCMFTITIQAAPDAMNDALATIENTNLAEDLFADNGSGADDLGFPAASIASFGGGSLGGAVTDNAAGSSVALAGGTLTVNANGSITLTGQPFIVSVFTFMYRLTNVAGSDDATVTITISPADVAPTVVAHSPANNATDIAINTDITVTFSEPVNAAAAFTLVGSSSGVHTFVLSGGPTMFTLNPNVDFDHLETVTLTVVATNVADQDLVDPPDNMAADFMFEFTTIGLAPSAANDAFTLAQCGEDLSENVFVDNGSGADELGVLAATLSHFGGGSLGGAVTDNAAAASVSLAGGSLSISTTGDISLTGVTDIGTFTVDYRLTNTIGTSDGTITITIAQTIFFVDNTAAAGNGSQLTPFQTLTAAAAVANASGDIIFLHTGSGAYTTGVTLDDGQLLIGEGVALGCPTDTVNTLVAAGTRPSITNAGGDGVTLGSGNTVRGLNIGNTSGPGISDDGASAGALIVNNVSISGTGGGIEVDNGGTLTVSLDEVSSTSSTDEGIHLAGVSGSFSVTTGTISSTGVAGVIIDGAASIDLGVNLVSVSSSAATNGINIMDATGSFTVAGNGATGAGISANNGSGGSITSTADGIALSNVVNTSFNYMDITNCGDNGIRGASVNGFVANRCNINDNGNINDESNIFMTALTGSIQAGANPTTISNCFIDRATEDNIVVQNQTGTLARLMISDCTIGSTNFAGGRNGDDGIDFEALSTGASNAVMNLTVNNSTFIGNGGDHINPTHNSNNGSMDVVITNNDMSGSSSNPGGVGGGITLASGGGTNVNTAYTYNVDNNDITGVVLVAIDANLGTSTSATTMSGTINNNRIGTAGVPGSGSTTGLPIRVVSNREGDHRVAVTNNSMSNWVNGAGITLRIRDGNGGNGSLTATVTGNTQAEPGTFAVALELTAGALGTDNGTLCADIGGAGTLANTFVENSAAAFLGDAVVFQAGTTVLNLPGYGGAANNPGATAGLDTYLTGRNTVTAAFTVCSNGGVGPFFCGALTVGITNPGAICP